MIRYEITDTASGLPISLAEAKEHLRVDIDTDDDYIESLIRAAWGYAERFTGRPMRPITVKQYFDDFPGRSIVLYWGDVTSVTHIKYYDTDGNLQTINSANYHTDLIMDRGRIVFHRNYSLPSVDDRPNAVEIEYEAGAATIPADVIHAMKHLIGEMYERRENHVKQLPTAVEWSLFPHRIWQI